MILSIELSYFNNYLENFKAFNTFCTRDFKWVQNTSGELMLSNSAERLNHILLNYIK